MLRSSIPLGNEAPTVHDLQGDANIPTTSLPDDFDQFMADAMADQPPLTAADLDAIWACEMEQRDAARTAGELPTIPALAIAVRPLDRSAWPVDAA